MVNLRPFWVLWLFIVILFILAIGVPILFAQINASDHLAGITYRDYVVAAAVLTGIVLLISFLAKRAV